MVRPRVARRLALAGLAAIATAPLSTDAGISGAGPAAPTLTHYGASPTAEAQSWNEQSAREAQTLPAVLNPTAFAVASRALYLWLVFTPLLSTALPAFWSEAFRRHAWYRSPQRGCHYSSTISQLHCPRGLDDNNAVSCW